MRLGDNWRYEREDGQLIIIFSKEGKLERFNWKLSNPDYAYKPGLIPVADSQSIKAVWRAEGTLSFNYLHEAAGDVLILYGDDGGYSGGHYDSNLYAVSRTTGKKLWQLDLGYSGASTTLDRDGKQLTVLYNKPDPKTKEFEPYIRRIRVADGKAIWEKKLHQEEQEGYTWLTGTAGVIAIYTEILERNGGKLTVWDAATGKPKWKKNMNASFHMLPAGKHDKYILIVQDHTIQALEPGTGKVAWKLSGKKRPENYNQPAFIAPDNYPIAPNEVKRWIYVGLEQLYVDLRTGKVLSRYTFGEGQNTSIEAIDDRYWLICKAQDAKNFWDAKQFATSLYDAIERKTLWEIQGLAEGGAVDNDNVYVVLDKLPAALRKSDGKIKWTIKNKQVASVLSSGSSYKRNIYDPPALFFAKGDLLLLAYGEDLLSIDKKKGKINYRIGDILLEYPDMMASYTRGGLVNEDERYLYLGSANGSFTKIEKSKLRP
nr:PQQ-binding-like beta-propeller repeat protein [Paenibacillus roseus]